MKLSRTKKLLFLIPVFCFWLAALVLGLEAWGRWQKERGARLSKQFDTYGEISKIRQGFHNDLWETPWEKYKPNSSASLSDGGEVYEININGLGFRGPEIEEADRDVYTIACIGGSTTVNGNTDSTTYPALLEANLNERGTRKVRVVNCGICGLKSGQYQDVLDLVVSRIRPDMVIEYNAINDICWKILWDRNRKMSERKEWMLKSQFVRYFLGNFLLPSDKVLREAIDKDIIGNLREAAETLRQHDIRFAVCSFIYPRPGDLTKEQYLFLDDNLRGRWRTNYVSYRKFCEILEMYNEAVKEAFEGTDVLFLPVDEEGLFPFEFFVDMCHLKHEGVLAKSNRLADLLEPHLPEGPVDGAGPATGAGTGN